MNRRATYGDYIYNPLKYIDPTGESCYGPSEAEKVQRAMNEARQRCWNQLWNMMEEYSKIYQQIKNGQNPFGWGTETPRGSRREGNSGDGKPKYAYKQFYGVNNIVTSDRGKCVLGSLGSARRCWDEHRWGESTKEWTEREKEFCEYKKEQDPNFDGHGYETGYFKEFLEYNPDPSRYNSYVAITGTGEITPDQIYGLMTGEYDPLSMGNTAGYIVAVFCTLVSGENHFANVESCTMYGDNSMRLEFSNPNPGMMPPLEISGSKTFDLGNSNMISMWIVAYKLTNWKL